MDYNPYEYMLEIRNNRVLFQYLEVSAVNFNEEHGWTITGQSREGTTEIYELASGILRVTLPITVPEFVSMSILQRIIVDIQNTIEGIITTAEDEDGVYIEYHLHASPELDSLDRALLKFVQERADINKGFETLVREYKKMERAMSNISEGVSAMLNKQSKGPEQPRSNENIEADLSNLWSEMENIDNLDDEDIDDIDPTEGS